MCKQLLLIQKGGFIGESVIGYSVVTGIAYLPLDRIPKLKFELQKLHREKLTHQEIYKVLAKESVIARIEASKDQKLLKLSNGRIFREKIKA